MENSNPIIVNVVIDKFIESSAHTVAPSTLPNDKSKAGKLKKYFKKPFITDASHSYIHDLIVLFHRLYSNKSINEFLIRLRANAPDYASAAANHPADVFRDSKTTSTDVSTDVSPDALALANALQGKPELKALIKGAIGGAL